MAGIAVDYLLVWFECLGTRSGSITAPATGRDRPKGTSQRRLGNQGRFRHCQGPREEADLVSTILKEVRRLLSLLHSGDGAAGYPLD
jgi:hypothetical protein